MRLQISVLDLVYLFYQFLISLLLTFILAIVVVFDDDSRYPVGPSPSSLHIVVVLGSIPSHPRNHMEGVLCCAFINASAMVCASYQLTLGMCFLFRLLLLHFQPLWLTSYPHEYQYDILLFSFMVLE